MFSFKLCSSEHYGPSKICLFKTKFVLTGLLFYPKYLTNLNFKKTEKFWLM